jgi:ribosomal protein S19
VRNEETNIVNAIRRDCSQGAIRLFRNGTGQAYEGQIRSPKGGVGKFSQDMIILRDPRIVRYGLAVGSSDLIGWRSIEITPDMVGQKIAQFVALEVKTDKGKMTDNQRHFIQQVNQAGGAGSVIHSVAEAQSFLGGKNELS